MNPSNEHTQPRPDAEQALLELLLMLLTGPTADPKVVALLTRTKQGVNAINAVAERALALTQEEREALRVPTPYTQDEADERVLAQ